MNKPSWSALFFAALLLGVLVFGHGDRRDAHAASNPNYANTPKGDVAQILNGTASASILGATVYPVTVVTAGASGSVRNALFATNNDGSNAYTLQVFKLRSSVYYLVWTVQVAINAGNVNGTPPQSLMPVPGTWMAIDTSGNSYMHLESGDTLVVASTTQVASNKAVSIFATGVDQ